VLCTEGAPAPLPEEDTELQGEEELLAQAVPVPLGEAEVLTVKLAKKPLGEPELLTLSELLALRVRASARLPLEVTLREGVLQEEADALPELDSVPTPARGDGEGEALPALALALAMPAMEPVELAQVLGEELPLPLPLVVPETVALPEAAATVPVGETLPASVAAAVLLPRPEPELLMLAVRLLEVEAV